MTHIVYTSSIATLRADQLRGGFFQGWPNPPSPETHLRMLQGSHTVWIALNEETQEVVGFIQALSDGVLTAFIPLLEVLPAYQKQGIGSALVQHMLESLSHLYSIDLVCDDDVIPFYEKLGLRPGTAMLFRNYDNQSGSVR